MLALRRTASGDWLARKAIPADVRGDYASTFGPGWEARLRLPGALSAAEAKAGYGAWLAEIETRIEAIRRRRNGEGEPLTAKQARALAGEWYNWFIERHEGKKAANYWSAVFGDIVEALEDQLPGAMLDGNPDLAVWLDEPGVREGVRPAVADWAQTSHFLAVKGIALTADARALFLDYVCGDYINALLVLRQRARGDYSPDELPRQFPRFERAGETIKPSAIFEAWIKERQPAPATVIRWRPVFLAMDARFPNANAINADDAREWLRGLIGNGRSARTIRETWLSAANRIFRYGIEQKMVRLNPFVGIKLEVPKQKKLREKAFTMEEATTILAAAKRIDWHKSMTASAKRWVPWICAYSGARAGEICQLRGQDVKQIEGVWSVVLTPAAGTIKTGEARTVPLHPHLIEQGFLDFVEACKDGRLFYSEKHSESSNPTKPRATQTAMLRVELARWVRSLGLIEKEMSPLHGWRHLFKKIADKAGISERTSDAITGHAPVTAGRGYGRADVSDMAAALEKFPQFKV